MISLSYSGGYILYARTSTDGINWSNAVSLNLNIGSRNDSRGLVGITFANGMFLVAGSNLNVVAYSSDGVNWGYASVDTSIGRVCGFLSNNENRAIAFNFSTTTPPSARPSPIILVDNKKCYTLDSEPTTSTVIYDNPGIQSELTVLEGGSQSITLSDDKIYNRNPSGDIII
jgi:hypothetical protein